MPRGTTPTVVTAPATNILSAQVAVQQQRNTSKPVRDQQHLDDQIKQFRAFLEQHIAAGLPLPAISSVYGKGRLSVQTLLTAASLSPHLQQSRPEFRQIAEEYEHKVGRVRSAEFRKLFPAPPPAVSSSADSMTYGDLMALDAGVLGLGQTSLAQYRSALDRFMTAQQKTVADQIGDELASGYEQALQQVIQRFFKGDHKLAKSQMSCMKKYRQVVAAHQRADSLPGSGAFSVIRSG